MKRYYVITGGTMVHVSPHFALCAPAYGLVGEEIHFQMLEQTEPDREEYIHLVGTRMTSIGSAGDGGHLESLYEEAGFRQRAKGFSPIETNEDLSRFIDVILKREDTKGIVMAAAVCDFEPTSLIPQQEYVPPRTVFGKQTPRLETKTGTLALHLKPSDKILQRIRKTRKDIFLVAFKTTAGATEDAQYAKGLHLLKGVSANLVLANDVHTNVNMIITPEEARYHTTTKRDEAIKNLVEMTLLRSHLTFTQSTVVAGEPVSWKSPEVPETLRAVVDYCVKRGAYKPFRGATVGHFACKLGERTTIVCSACGSETCTSTHGASHDLQVEKVRSVFLTSKRKSNFNDIDKLGLVKIETDGPDTVLAYGAKPSVGGQSQRIVFKDHPGMDCIVHFHCPIKPDSTVPVVSQREYECGSHECGKNTSNGLKEFTESSTDGINTLKAVFLDQHGPNIVFNRDTNAQMIIDFIEENFDLDGKTGGIVK